MDIPEFIRIIPKYFLNVVAKRYNIDTIDDSNGYVYIPINKGMYSLKWDSVLAYNNLVQQLTPHGYYPNPHATGIWNHENKHTNFCLCIDDFGIKCDSKYDADHLLHVLQKYYKITVNWNSKNYCDIKLGTRTGGHELEQRVIGV